MRGRRRRHAQRGGGPRADALDPRHHARRRGRQLRGHRAKVDENGKPILDKDGKPIIVTVNRPTKVLDLINQRPLIEGEIERRIRPEGQKSCVTIREVRLGEPAIPPELLVAVRREQLATQLAQGVHPGEGRAGEAHRFREGQGDRRPAGDLVRAEIGVQTSSRTRRRCAIRARASATSSRRSPKARRSRRTCSASMRRCGCGSTSFSSSACSDSSTSIRRC